MYVFSVWSAIATRKSVCIWPMCILHFRGIIKKRKKPLANAQLVCERESETKTIHCFIFMYVPKLTCFGILLLGTRQFRIFLGCCFVWAATVAVASVRPLTLPLRQCVCVCVCNGLACALNRDIGMEGGGEGDGGYGSSVLAQHALV